MTTAELRAFSDRQGHAPWVIDGLLRPGFTILSAASKVGKSRLAITNTACVADGRPFLDEYATRQSHVLFFALEPTAHDVKEALENFGLEHDVDIDWRIGEEMPPNADFQWFEGEIAQVKEKRPDLGLVVVDMFDNIPTPETPEVKSTDNAYQQYRGRLRPLQSLAKRHDIALLALMHTATGTANPVGGNGVMGTADNLWGLTRANETGELHVNGRSIREQTVELTWCSKRGVWQSRKNNGKFRVPLSSELNANEVVPALVDYSVGTEWISRPELIAAVSQRLDALGHEVGPQYLDQLVDGVTKTRVRENAFQKNQSRPVRFRRRS